MTLKRTAFKGERFQLISAAPGAPAAGARLQWTTPDRLVVEIQSITFRLVTAVAAADRVVYVQGENAGGSTFSKAAAVAVQIASLTRYYAFSVGILPVDYGSEDTWFYNTMPCCLFLQAGEHFVVGVSNIQAADQISGIEIRYLAWNQD